MYLFKKEVCFFSLTFYLWGRKISMFFEVLNKFILRPVCLTLSRSHFKGSCCPKNDYSKALFDTESPKMTCATPFCQQHLFPDADQDLDDLEIEQQEVLFNKMEGNKDDKQAQGPQVREQSELPKSYLACICSVALI